jgi:hypothetical protein
MPYFTILWFYDFVLSFNSRSLLKSEYNNVLMGELIVKPIFKLSRPQREKNEIAAEICNNWGENSSGFIFDSGLEQFCLYIIPFISINPKKVNFLLRKKKEQKNAYFSYLQ